MKTKDRKRKKFQQKCNQKEKLWKSSLFSETQTAQIMKGKKES